MVADHRGSVKSLVKWRRSSRTFQVRDGSFFLSEIFVRLLCKICLRALRSSRPTQLEAAFADYGAPEASTLFIECGRAVGLA